MVTTEIGQLSSECMSWISELRSLREHLTSLKHRLVSIASRQHNKDILLEIEHLDNQLHIQLINIHDVKQSIKLHQRKVEMEKSMAPAHMSEERLQEHESLFEEFEDLKGTIDGLKSEFVEFSSQVD